MNRVWSELQEIFQIDPLKKARFEKQLTTLSKFEHGFAKHICKFDQLLKLQITNDKSLKSTSAKLKFAFVVARRSNFESSLDWKALEKGSSKTRFLIS